MLNRKTVILSVASFFILGQFIPVDKSNPESTGEIVAEKDVKSIFEKSCYDCHSNKTVWPSYSKIFPISFFVSKHVKEGREELNFSEWENLSLKKKKTKSTEVIEEIESNEMPPKLYLVFHKKSSVGSEELAILKKWALKFEREYEIKNK